MLSLKHIIRKIIRTVIGAGFGAASALLLNTPLQASEDAHTIVSVDYCADQFVLALAAPQQIMALSKDAQSPFSFYAEHAKSFPLTRGSSEQILTMQPDITVRQWYGARATDRLYERAGIKSISIGFAGTPEGNFDNLITFAEKIGRTSAAKAFVDKRKALIKSFEIAPKAKGKALYITPGGFSAGRGTFVHHIINLAGFTTTADTYGQTGWAPLPLEAIVNTPPDVIITSFNDLETERSRWSASNYPLIKDLLESKPVIDVPSRYLSCSGLFAADAAQLIREKAIKLGLILHE